MPSESVPLPWSVTTSPPLTVWLDPALAVGGLLAGGFELPPPPPPPHAASRRPMEAQRAGVKVRVRIPPYTEARRFRRVKSVRAATPATERLFGPDILSVVAPLVRNSGVLDI